jgi:lipopolysaccharide transport system ATP-binding protein
MSNTVIKVENISKQYRLGEVGTGSLSHDVNRWWHKVRGKEDPYLKIGDSNDRTQKGNTDYVWALKNINFEVKQGEVLGIVGRNGAGKSTLLKILSRTTTPTTGSIKIKGRVASLLEVGTGFHPELSGRDNIYLNGAILGMSKQEITKKFDEIVDFAGVERYIDTPVKRYSSGMYVRLAFGVAAHLEPEILIVDEVLAVGDAEFQKKALGKMQDVSTKDGRTVLFVSHNMATVQNLCNKAILMQHGTVIETGTANSIITSYIRSGQTDFAVPLLNRTDRSGNGKVIFVGCRLEDANGQPIDCAMSGSEVHLVFGLQKKVPETLTIDIGIAFSTATEQLISILYSSYQNCFLQLTETMQEIRLVVPKWPFASGFYKLVGRILINGEEADSLQNGLTEIQVIEGDFYLSGNFGSMGTGPVLLDAIWKK